MPQCEGCGAFVSSDFARVMGDNDGNVHGCLECHDRVDIRDSGVVTGSAGGSA